MTVDASRSCLGLGTCVGSATRQIVVSRVPDRTRRIRNGPPPPASQSHLVRTVPPRLAPNTVISTFEVGRRFRCTMRIDYGSSSPGQ